MSLASLIGYMLALGASLAGGPLVNPDFTQVIDGRFAGWSQVGSYQVEGQAARAECAVASEAAGLVQIVRCDPPLTYPFTASARARCENVGTVGDFAVWLDLIHADGSPSWAHVAGFSRGTHDWEQAKVDVVPAKPVAEIRFHLLLRGTTGRAWFAEPELKPTPLAFRRLEAVRGLWGPRSLSIRAETNLPATIGVEGLPAAATRPASERNLQRISVDLAEAPPALLTGPAVVRAKAAEKPSNGVTATVQVRMAAGAAMGNVRAWLTDSTTRVFTDSLPEEAKALKLGGARCGHVSFQVGLAAHPDGSGGNVEVGVRDLELDDGGARLPATAWQKHCVGYIRNELPARHPALERDGPTWWPDALLPYRPLSIPAGQTRAVVLNLRIPEGQPPGVYRGYVEIRPASGTTQRLPFTMRVHSFTIPTRLRMKTAFALMDGFLEQVYGALTPELRRAYTAFVLDHRLNPDDISRTRLPDLDELEWARDRGLTAFNTLNLVPEPKEKVTWVCFSPVEAYTPEFKRRLIERLDAFVPELKRRGLLDYAYVYGFDERGAEYLPIMREYFGLIKERYPTVRTLSTCWPPAGTDPATLNIDWYCPLSNKFDPAEAAKARARGGEMWWYICMGPTWPYANWLFEYPLTEARVIWWQAWQNRVDGFLYWGLNIWDRPHNERPIADDADELLAWSVTPFEPLHGDGVLLYPGEHGPIGSLRLLAIRDGLEDTAILDAAERKLGRTEVERLTREVSRGMTEFTRDVEVVGKVRRALLERLEE